jgi:hypothetical protein
VTGFVGHGANVRAFELHIDEGQVFTRFLIQHVPDEVCIILLLRP